MCKEILHHKAYDSTIYEPYILVWLDDQLKLDP